MDRSAALVRLLSKQQPTAAAVLAHPAYSNTHKIEQVFRLVDSCQSVPRVYFCYTSDIKTLYLFATKLVIVVDKKNCDPSPLTLTLQIGTNLI